MKLSVSIPVKNLLLPASETRATHMSIHLLKNGSHVDGSDVFVPITGDAVKADLGDHPDSVYVLEYRAKTANGEDISPMFQVEVRPNPIPQDLT